MSDISLHFVQQGAGFPLLLLHGNGEDHSYFAGQMDAFAAHRTVYALDTRGHGQSPRGHAPFTIDQFARDLLAFMDEHGLEQADLLGFSDGGNIALTFALAHPDRVRRLVLNGANLDPSGVEPAVQLPIVAGYKLAALFAGRSERARRHWELLDLMVTQPRIAPCSLKALTVPTLVLVGSRDMIRLSHTLLIARNLPNARLKILNGDHFIAAKRPAAFNRAALDFLEEEKSAEAVDK